MTFTDCFCPLGQRRPRKCSWKGPRPPAEPEAYLKEITGVIALSVLWKQEARLSVPLTCKISNFCRFISLGKPIAEIPPNPPLQRGAGGISGKSFQKAKPLPLPKGSNGSQSRRLPEMELLRREGMERRGSASGDDFDSDGCVLFQRRQGGVFFLDLSQESQLLDQFLHFLRFYFCGDDFVAFPG